MSKQVRHLIENKHIYDLSEDTTIRSAAQYMVEKKANIILISRQGQVISAISQNDVISRVIADGLDPSRTTLKDVMNLNPVKLDIHENILLVFQKMCLLRATYFCITDKGHIIGAISSNDLNAAVNEQLQEELSACTAYVQGNNYSVVR